MFYSAIKQAAIAANLAGGAPVPRSSSLSPSIDE
jgi:hypothetical protein